LQTSPPALVVSIHDVSPLTRPAVEGILEDLAGISVAAASLLVIPDHHHRAPLSEDPACGEWLRQKESQGHEIVLHGFFHRRPPQGGWSTRLVTEHYTAGEGEFYDLSEAEAAQRLEKGRATLASAGLSATGFIAPAWLLGPEAERAVRQAGFAYTTRLAHFKDLATGRLTPSQSLVWSVRSGWRRQVSLWWNASLARRLAPNPLFRVGIHPPDWEYPAVRRQVLQLTGAALAGREVMTYDGWLHRLRSLS